VDSTGDGTQRQDPDLQSASGLAFAIFIDSRTLHSIVGSDVYQAIVQLHDRSGSIKSADLLRCMFPNESPES
jgi:hypothetical protein